MTNPSKRSPPGVPTRPAAPPEATRVKPHPVVRESPADSDGPRAIQRVVSIANLLARTESGATLAEIAAQIGAPKSSVHALMRALVNLEMAVRKGERYVLGPALFSLALAVQARYTMTTMARPFMQRLHEGSGETAILAALDRSTSSLVYVDQIESANPVRYTATIGNPRPLYCSGAGRVLLAFQDAPWREEYYARGGFVPITTSTVTDVDEIRRKVDRARVDGFATSVEEMTDGAASCAAPIFQRDGSVSHSLMIATVAFRLRQRGELFRSMVTSVANEFSRALGYDGVLPGSSDDQRRAIL